MPTATLSTAPRKLVSSKDGVLGAVLAVRMLHALAWYGRGLGFGDALHLASSRPADVFVTFDERLARAAPLAGSDPEVRLLDGAQMGSTRSPVVARGE